MARPAHLKRAATSGWAIRAIVPTGSGEIAPSARPPGSPERHRHLSEAGHSIVHPIRVGCSRRTAHRRHHRTAPPRRAVARGRTRVGRNLPKIGEWLVVHRRQLRNDIHRRPCDRRIIRCGRCQDVSATLRASTASSIRAFRKADRKGPHRPPRLHLHQSNDGRQIDPARQKCAKRHIGEALPLDRRSTKAAATRRPPPSHPSNALRLRGNLTTSRSDQYGLGSGMLPGETRRQK